MKKKMAQLNLFTLPTPSMPILDTSRCKVRRINYQTAAEMVLKYHYAHRVPSICLAVGLYVDDVLAGCVTYGIPPNRNALGFCGESCIPHGLELNRLFVHDWAGRNSESFLVGQSLKLLRQIRPDCKILISYADTEHHHIGTIYQATNWVYTGTSTFNGKTITLDGKEYHHRDMSRLFSSEQEIIDMGGIVKERKPKHRYIYFLGTKLQRRKLRKLLKWPVLPYPKKGMEQ